MALRGGASRRMPNNALGGILRDLDRRSRTPTRRSSKSAGSEPVEGPRGPRGPRGPAGPPSELPGAAAVVVTQEGGWVTWEYPAPFEAPPVLTAVAVTLGPTTVSVEDVEASYAVLRVWTIGATRLGAAGAGVRVHVTACPVFG